MEMTDKEIIKECKLLIRDVDKSLGDDEYRKKCIDKIYNRFNISQVEAECYYDIASCGECLYSGNDYEIEFKICYRWNRYIIYYVINGITITITKGKGHSLIELLDICDEASGVLYNIYKQ